MNSEEERPSMEELYDRGVISDNGDGTFGVCDDGKNTPTYSSAKLRITIEEENAKLREIVE